MIKNRTQLLLGFALSAVLLVGGIATGAGTLYQRDATLRGWIDPTQNADLPRRLPLAGVNVELTQYDAPTLDRELNRIAAAGFVWVRQTFAWPDIEQAQGEFDFSKTDPIVAAVNAHPPLRLVAVLDETPTWARRPDASDRLIGPPVSMAAFGNFAGRFAAHYAGKIAYYQVWDEPNLTTHWGGLDPRPADYAAMLKAAYNAIHGSDPQATVIAAALAPTVETGPHNLSDVLYLRALYDVGAADSFDAAAGKPYGFDQGPDDRTVSQDVLNFSHIILLREEMVRHGDGHKALWGSNFGWNHLPAGWSGSPSIWGQVDANTQRRYTRDAYLRAEREWPWLGGLIVQHWQPAAPADDPIQGFAVSQVAADWFESGAFFARSAPGVGLYDPADPRFTYRGDWRFGPLGADVRHQTPDEPPADGSANQLTFQFEGSALAFLVRRADYVAYLYVGVDGQPASSLPRNNGDAYIMLKSPDLATHTDLIVAASNLNPGTHSAEVRAYLGYDRWELAGIAVGATPDTRRFDLLIAAAAFAALSGLTGVMVTGRRLIVPIKPGDLAAMAAYVHRMADILAGIAVSGLAMIGLFLTWGDILPNVFRRDPPTVALVILTIGLIYLSPAFIVTVVALVALWLIIYNRPVVGLALVVFWAPFLLMPVVLFNRALPMVEVCLALTFSAVVLRAMITWKPRRIVFPALRAADLAMLAFVAVATISLVWSEQREPALREWRTMVIEPAVFYLLLRTVRLTNRDTVRLTDVLLLAGVAVAGIGLYHYFHYVPGVPEPGVVIAEQGSLRLASVYGSPNNAALFLGRCTPFALAMLLMASSAVRRVIAGMTLAIIAVAIVLTQSGGAILLGVPAAVICVLILWNRRRGAVAAGAVAAALLALIPLSRFIPRLQGVLDLSRSSSLNRSQVWASAVNLLRERPLTGAGLDQFLYLYRSRYILPDAWREPDLSHPHNIVLDYWISLGILGLAILAVLQVAFWRSALAAWRRWRGADVLLAAVAVGAMGSMADFLAHGLVDNSYFVVDLAYVFCLTLALVLRLEKPIDEAAG
jgi:O-antigen ligase